MGCWQIFFLSGKLLGFWDDGNDLSEEEHWKVNQKWGMALLESIVED